MKILLQKLPKLPKALEKQKSSFYFCLPSETSKFIATTFLLSFHIDIHVKKKENRS